jgi:hypothetical protein
VGNPGFQVMLPEEGEIGANHMVEGFGPLFIRDEAFEEAGIVVTKVTIVATMWISG